MGKKRPKPRIKPVEGQVFVINFCENPSCQIFVGVVTEDEILNACRDFASDMYPARKVLDVTRDDDFAHVDLSESPISPNKGPFSMLFDVEGTIVNKHKEKG